MDKWRALLEKKQKAQKLVDEYKEAVMEHKLRRGLSAEAYSRMFAPVTKKLEDVSESLTEKLGDVTEKGG